MTQPVSAQQKISAIVLSGMLFASVVFAHQKQHPPITSFKQTTPVEYVPRFDAAYQAARDAEQNAKPESIEVTRQAVFDATIGSLEAAPTPKTAPTDAHDLATQQETQPFVNTETGTMRSASTVDQPQHPRLMADREGIQQALSLGLIRVATDRDAQLYIEAYNKFAAPRGSRLTMPADDGSSDDRITRILRHNSGYVILKNMQMPEGMGGANAVTFILPTGVPYPKGELGHSVLLNMSDGSCSAVVRELCNYRD